MAKAGETPQAQFKQGDNLAYGEAAAANSLMGLVGPAVQPEPHQPQGPEDQFLFSPTDRPNEPITHGAAFGPGAGAIQGPSDDQLVEQVSQQALNDPAAPTAMRRFAQRQAQGM